MAAIVTGAILGLVGATLGWAVSWVIGPGRVEGLTLGLWPRVTVSVAAQAAVTAAIGAVAQAGLDLKEFTRCERRSLQTESLPT